MPRVKKRRKIYDVRVWPTWIVIGVAWLVARLPLAAIRVLATTLGGLVYTLGRRRRHITLTNLELCFPERSDGEREALARSSFVHTAWGMLETMIIWLNPRRDISPRLHVEGVEHLAQARSRGRGVILLGAHFSVIDIMGPAMAPYDLDVVYAENRNPAWEWLQLRGRRRYFDGVIERADTRSMLRRLKAGRTFWYAADQDYGPRRSVFAPFFGIPTASVRATAQLARFNASPVLLISTWRDVDSLTWHARINPIITNYPTGDDVADATRINQVIEQAIREHPEQYLWMHRRFKTRPEGDPSFY